MLLCRFLALPALNFCFLQWPKTVPFPGQQRHLPVRSRDSEKQYKTQIKKWNLDTKYTKASEYVAMIKTQKRRERENPGKQTRFTLRGRPIDPRDIARFEKRAMKKGGVNFEEAEEGGGKADGRFLGVLQVVSFVVVMEIRLPFFFPFRHAD